MFAATSTNFIIFWITGGGWESVNQKAVTPLIPGVKLERRLFRGLFSTPDQKEDMAAFAEKRKPNYTKY